jgi:ubiquinone/menaquinone biosynthesis C-methylase UbiE
MCNFDHFGLIAPWYDRLIIYHNDDLIKRLAELPTPGRLLDIGGGTGRVSNSLHGSMDEIEIADVSIGMLKIARRKELNATCASGDHLPFPRNSFSRVVMVDALHHFYNQNTVIQEVWRVLELKGILLIVEPNYDTVAGKMIRILEKMLIMKSNFLSDAAIVKLVSVPTANVSIEHFKGSSYFIFRKT